ncbi:Hypothetical predicted protein [Paramuricea clavata]|uniref:Uncharacterized protein n=1 Tax=Paramuricea clavata TaxID=317549 RepID=A0A7D9HPW4_PARCT|nr:Hypothetical predicted protein [Paramuricea clavata]
MAQVCGENCSCGSCTKKWVDAKEIFEGKGTVLLCGDSDDWFDDEDEEFVFTRNNEWFERAWSDGVKERDEMLHGYKQLDDPDEEFVDSADEEFVLFSCGYDQLLQKHCENKHFEKDSADKLVKECDFVVKHV